MMNRLTYDAGCLTRRAVLLSALAAAGPARAGLFAGLPAGSAFSRAMERLGDRLLNAVGLAAPDGNCVLSPWSLHATLGLLGLGARGSTSAALAALLGADAKHLAGALHAGRQALATASTDAARVRRGEAAWGRAPLAFQRRWQMAAAKALDMRATALDFAAPEALATVNGWAARATDGAIPTLLEQFPADAAFILTSAIHFAGKWATPFDPAETAPAPFHMLNGGTADAPMMRAERTVLYGQSGPGHAVVLPYAGNRIALLLATARQTEDSAAFLDKLRATGAIGWLRGVAFAPTGPMELRLPRFGFVSGGDRLPAINALGRAPALGRGADLTGITGKRVALDAIIHRASIRVDEQGTVAAAATAAIASRSFVRDAASFIADRPFAFVLATWPGAGGGPFLPLFVGYVGDAAHATA